MEGSTNSNSLADPARLEIIDKLFEFNIGDSVPLPQLLVVGDQSSGKSSVLEGLTGLSFPRKSGLCTRFATQITFRRARDESVAISLIPSNDAYPDHAEKLRAWKKDDLYSLEGSALEAIIEEVSSLMGITPAGEKGGNPFSEDVLKIEIRGPGQQHLSVIDVPGIFKRTTAGYTTKADMEMVKNMVSRYMKNPRAAILAIIPANVDIATQEILEMAEEYDTHGHRTLGVLTKPDLVDKGAEQNVMDLVQGRSHVLSLGWCIVRNLGQRELSSSPSERHALETNFFKSREPWVRLDKDRVGIKPLQSRLRDILAEIVRREFPGVKLDINKKLSSCKQQLEALGSPRETTLQQQDYLLDLATRFQKISSLALDARYGGDDIFEEVEDLRLATSIVTRNEEFSNDAWRNGHTVDFGGPDPEPKPLVVRPPQFIPENCVPCRTQENVSSTESSVEPEDFKHSSNGYTKDLEDIVHKGPSNGYTEDLEDLIHKGPKVTKVYQDIMPWLKSIYTSSRGFELGTFDPVLISLIWKKQSVNWDGLALGYISDVIIIVHRFIRSLLRAICLDERVLNELTFILMEDLRTRYRKAIDQVQFILQVERAGTPMTLNHYFNENLEKCRQERQRKSMEKLSFDTGAHGRVVHLQDVYEKANMSNVDHTIRDLHDILKSYYKVARKRFVDVVCMQGSDFHLVTGPDTPTKVFSPSFVTNLKPEDLERISGETVVMRKKRAELIREISNLENAKKILI
ncbi:hypothetical protein MMC07_002013 [Pseudocyphellaria aurata]|nr:hypothetical protein [Pseudocyphellaria aurata]